MLSVHLRPVDDDGAIGPALGTAFLRDGAVVYEGSTVLAEVVAALAQRFGLDEKGVLTRLVVDGWSNGKMVISADAG
jgi:hypothetical protein